MTVAVNVSAVQFRQEGFCELIRRLLHETGLAPQYLELELTEGLLLANADVTLSVLKELKAMGLTLAIDDFGTGYSSFNYLRQFQVGKIKIDRSFIQYVAVKPDDAAITAAIISMARSLNLKVIAEGVEDEAQMRHSRSAFRGAVRGSHRNRVRHLVNPWLLHALCRLAFAYRYPGCDHDNQGSIAPQAGFLGSDARGTNGLLHDCGAPCDCPSRGRPLLPR